MHPIPADDSSVIATLGDVTKRFGAVNALSGCSVSLRRAEVHALIGANGAGKSTLSRIIAGHIPRTSGTYRFKGEAVDFASPREGLTAGISIVMQETSIAPDLSVLENIALAEFGTRGRTRWNRMREKAANALVDIEQSPDLLHLRAGDLSIAQRQMIEICKALYNDSDVIIFDEPTASFSPLEVEQLFAVMRLLRERGKSLVFVSHRLEEILEITDRITVIRDGRTVATDIATSSITTRDLVRWMVGRDIENVYESAPQPQASASREHAVLDVRHLASAPLLRDLSFSVGRGEIVGLAGLVGAGRSEALESLFGLRKMQGGEVLLDGKPYRPETPIKAIRAGMGFIGEDRRRQGLVPDLSVQENLLLARLGRRRAWFTDYGTQTSAIDALFKDLDMPVHVRDVPMLSLSGGQQQKVLLARWLMLSPSILLLDEPTRGVDIGARSTLYRIIRKVAASGVAVVVVSSDFEEALGLCDRIVVMSDGVSVAEVPSHMLDPAILTMLSMPRSSARQMKAVLDDIAREIEGAAFWVQIERGRVFCLDLVERHAMQLGFAPTHFPMVEQTALRALWSADTQDGQVVEDGAVRAVKLRLVNASGHAFGEIGMSIPSNIDAAPLSRAARIVADALARHAITHIRVAIDTYQHEETLNER
ncbi:sugar ABC transporter ATP-binding protein [Pararobbsia silviterrae]|uniref:Sugar ABC transporter ATP-binding protein n=1 Tax=Pararobbsia silviterrae TaxID=1792498 RepID=A0A494Y1J5_9BURK|nr:sugar ABC transporter ATP-binding protein [Pararobbsia silviterrae]RKP53735.1 sugar ABC transporter ATP-binding protein [Pararobbsia silviterrae]